MFHRRKHLSEGKESSDGHFRAVRPTSIRRERTGADEAYLLLRTVFTVAPIVFGID